MKRGLLAVLLAGALAQAAGARSPDLRVLAYEAPDGIHLVQADGSGDRRVAASRPGDQAPRWSPDGKRLAVFSTDSTPGGIFVLGVDGGRRRLTSDPTDEYPVWSGDGKSILFDSQRLSTPSSIYQVSAEGGMPRRIASGYYPEVAPDGTLAYTTLGVRLGLRLPGSGTTRQLPTSADAWGAVWFPNAFVLAFETDGDHGNTGEYQHWAVELHTIRADGTGEAALTSNHVNDSDPSVSPDGSTIAFDSDRFGWAEVLLMNADGSHQRRLTHELHGDVCCPAWKP